MDSFEFFFTLYSLILGLALAELLNGVSGLVRARQLRRVGLQTALLATFILLAISATWLDAWRSLRDVQLNFEGLALPMVIAICYYLAASIVFPKDTDEWASLDDYYADRKVFVVALLLAAETALTATFVGIVVGNFQQGDLPAVWQWLWYNALIFGSMIALLFVRRRWINLALLVGLLLLFLIPYWFG